MNTYLSRLISPLLAVIPMLASAQTNIKSAFDALIKCPDVQITESHSLEKDPGTNTKTGQSDIYNFTLPAKRIKLIENITSAFNKDSEMAYSINSGNTTNTENAIIKLAIGDGSGEGVYINEPECQYIYSLFLPPRSEDPNGIYRYAYGFNYKQEGSNIIGKLVVTYATTLKHRQQAQQNRQLNILNSIPNGSIIVSTPQQTWFDLLMSYFQSMASSSPQVKISLATKAYNVIRDTQEYPEVTENDKNTVREILKGMIADKKYSDTMLNTLLNQCLVGIE
ncbi:MAG: hypothetical protein K2K37_03180 [Muribaculaceae bacterium]|nr:hypothetical protein [Muribaculaceae bacterium]